MIDPLRWFVGLALAVLLQIGPAGCNSAAPDPAAPAGHRVVCTTAMVGDLAAAVLGPRGTVTTLIGAGVDPHLYQPARSDITALRSADLIFYNGLMLEGRMTDVLEQEQRPDRPAVAVTDGIDHARLLAPDGDGGHADPHLWMDVALWMDALDYVVDTVTAFDPEHADEYRERGAAYRAELAALDEYVREVIESIPASGRVLVTAHDAFSYFGRAYGIEVIGIQGISTESEAGVQDINRLVDTLVDRQVRAVFVESSVAAENVQALVEGAAARNWAVTIGGTLFSDAMGEPGTYRGTYPGMLDHNATTIARALGGTAPPAGRLERLDPPVRTQP